MMELFNRLFQLFPIFLKLFKMAAFVVCCAFFIVVAELNIGFNLVSVEGYFGGEGGEVGVQRRRKSEEVWRLRWVAWLDVEVRIQEFGIWFHFWRYWWFRFVFNFVLKALVNLTVLIIFV